MYDDIVHVLAASTICPDAYRGSNRSSHKETINCRYLTYHPNALTLSNQLQHRSSVKLTENGDSSGCADGAAAVQGERSLSHERIPLQRDVSGELPPIPTNHPTFNQTVKI